MVTLAVTTWSVLPNQLSRKSCGWFQSNCWLLACWLSDLFFFYSRIELNSFEADRRISPPVDADCPPMSAFNPYLRFILRCMGHFGRQGGISVDHSNFRQTAQRKSSIRWPFRVQSPPPPAWRESTRDRLYKFYHLELDISDTYLTIWGIYSCYGNIEEQQVHFW